jgi:hypothetical protein
MTGVGLIGQCGIALTQRRKGAEMRVENKNCFGIFLTHGKVFSRRRYD